MAVRAVWFVVVYVFALLTHALPTHIELTTPVKARSPLPNTSSLLARAQPVIPQYDDFYKAPEGFEKQPPGTILKHRNTPNPIAAFRLLPVNIAAAHQMLYRTNDNDGAPIATVVTVLVPHNADFNKLLSYQVAEDAASINCAPSYAIQLESASGGPFGTILTQVELVMMISVLEKGWVLALPDAYGPKGAFLANKLAGHATLDGIRASLGSNSITGINKDARVAMWGYSGGSLSSSFAAELQPTYAPELASNLVGVALGGMVPVIEHVIYMLNKTPFAGLIVGGMGGLGNQYGYVADLFRDQVKPEYKAKFYQVLNQCLGANLLTYAFADVLSWMKDPGVLKSTNITTTLAENSQGQFPPKIPVFMYKGALDQISTLKDTEDVYNKYCAAGTDVELKVDLAAEHLIEIIAGAPEAFIWLNKRMKGEPVKKGCSRSTELTGLLSPGALEMFSTSAIRILLDLLGKPIGDRLIG